MSHPFQIVIHPEALGPLRGLLESQDVPIEVVHWTADGFTDTQGNRLHDAAPQAVWLSFEYFVDKTNNALLEMVAETPSIEWLQTVTAGLDAPGYQRILQSSVRVANSNAQATAMAEYVIANVLGVYQGQANRYSARAANKWSRRGARELHGAKWLIVGFGSIGELVADRAVGFGCEVVGLRRTPCEHPSAKVASIDTLFAELPTADIVVLATPLNESTRNIADEKFFSAMKPGSLLVNVGRGALIDDEALLVALEARAPEHAVLDVFREEPLPSEHPFWAVPNLFITAHISAWGDRISERSVGEFVENLRRFIAGESLRKEVAKTCDN